MTRIATALAALLMAAPAAAQSLDTRAASQRTCLEVAEHHGLRVLFLARPVPIMGRRPGDVLGETVRVQVAIPGGREWLQCTYVIEEMRAELRRF
jgi:hypothetical protein